jgi:hypothetical protein
MTRVMHFNARAPALPLRSRIEQTGAEDTADFSVRTGRNNG